MSTTNTNREAARLKVTRNSKEHDHATSARLTLEAAKRDLEAAFEKQTVIEAKRNGLVEELTGIQESALLAAGKDALAGLDSELASSVEARQAAGVAFAAAQEALVAHGPTLRKFADQEAALARKELSAPKALKKHKRRIGSRT